MTERFAICVENGEYEGLLDRWKVYAILEDRDAESHGQYRVVDESGEDFLYPVDYFSMIDLPASLASLYRSTHARQE
jgi:hypothetical protein